MPLQKLQKTICIRALAAVAAACAPVACGRAPGDPDPSFFRSNSLFRVEPIPNLSAAGAHGPHDGLGLRIHGNTPDGGAPEARRVLILGGSFVYGYGAPAGESIVAKVDEILKSQPRLAVKTANGGCPGHFAATAAMRLHFILYAWKPSLIVYIPGFEDMSVYAAAGFAPDLNHVPRPFTGQALPEPGLWTAAGAAAFERDLRTLEVIARTGGARLIIAAPDASGRAAALRDPVFKVSKQRNLSLLDLPAGADAVARAVADAIRSSK